MKLKEITDAIWCNNLKMYVESLTTILPYKKIIDTLELTKYAFIFNDDIYVVDFDYKNAVELKFAVLTFYMVDKNNKLIYDQTNKNKYASPCFGTVLDIIKQEKNNWNAICFTGSGESRVGIYTQLFKKHASDMFTYHQLLPEGTLFIISKIKIQPELLTILVKTAEDIISRK